jgi:uncharacterized membrane protein
MSMVEMATDAVPSVRRQEWLPERRRKPESATDGLARALGLFSIGLGAAELLAPRRVSQLAGADERSLLVRALGMREIASGVGILMGRRPKSWVWSRLAGDLMDMALLGAALNDRRAQRSRLTASLAAVAGVTALDYVAARRVDGRQQAEGARGAFRVRKTLAVNCPKEQAYAFWRNLTNLPRFMEHLEAVEIRDGERSHWTARAPAGGTVEWDAEMVEDVPNERIAWRSVEGADVPNRGSVEFASGPGGRGSLVRVDLAYEPPAGALGRAVAKLFGEEPEQQVEADLRRFKQVLETGEVPTTEGQPTGRRSLVGRVLTKWRE